MVKLFPRQKFLWVFIVIFLACTTSCRKNDVAPTSDAPQLSITNRTLNANLTVSAGTIPLKNMFGVDSYAWDFLQNPSNKNDVSKIYEPKMALLNTFSAVRQYLQWSKIEYEKGNYTFNPSHDGSWNLDIINQRCKQDGIVMLADIKDQPTWLMYTYPSSEWNNQNIPMPYGTVRDDPASYILQAKAAFQFAARYGSNTKVNPALVKVATWSRWTNDPANVVEIGLNTINYIECDNERDKWWLGPQAQQTPEEYAANMSAFYDGNLGKLGKDAGVKNADPNIKVVMGGLATANVAYVNAMIAWCKKYRGLKADGSVNLCFDVINYHWYSNNGNVLTNTVATTGVAPELNPGGTVADGFVKLAASLPSHPEVWITEAGYDINPKSTQRAIAIGNKSAQVTQADWNLRTALMYMRHGINRLFFYQLFDDVTNGPITFQTAGMANADVTRRPSLYYIAQVSQLMGNYTYSATLNSDPLVDKYMSGTNTMYALMIPDQKGRTGNYTLNLATSKQAYVYTLSTTSTTINKKLVNVTGGKLTLTVTETPQFVQGL
jgi:hypothetical protein